MTATAIINSLPPQIKGYYCKLRACKYTFVSFVCLHYTYMIDIYINAEKKSVNDNIYCVVFIYIFQTSCWFFWWYIV